MQAKANCSICGKEVTPETGVSVAGRWIICNEHAPLVRDSIVTVGRTAMHGLSAYLKHRAPKIHKLFNATIVTVLQQRSATHD